jgi:hypothetical protein
MVEDFWGDMERAILDNREHFLGNIVLSAEGGEGTQSIVDGQQRIVTTTILLAALRDHFRKSGDEKAAEAVGRYVGQHDVETFSDLPRVRMNPDDNPYYFAKIVEGKTVTPTKESHELMEGAYKFFVDKLLKVQVDNPSTWKKQLGNYNKFLGKQARVVVVQSPTDADAFTVFETLNDRGADLTISDLLKNLLFSRAKVEIDVVQQYWIEARTIIDELKPRTDMMTFLRHFWSSRHGATRERDLYNEIKRTVNTQAEALSFAKALREDAALYRALLSPSDEKWKSFSQTSKVALQTFDRFNLEQIRPMLLAIHRHFPEKEAEKSIKSVLSWSVRGLVGGVIGGGKAEAYFCDAAIAIRNGSTKSVSELMDNLKDLIPNDAQFREAMERYRTTNNVFARYLLYCIERKLGNQKEPELLPNENVDEVNLEHVLPQKAKQVDWPNFQPETVSIYAYRLGNMTLLQKGPNGKIGNKPWAVKHPVLSQSNFKLNTIFKAASGWDQQAIEARQMHFSGLAPAVWPLL